MSAFNDVRDKLAFRMKAFRLLKSWGVPENDADYLANFHDPDGRDMPGQFAKTIYGYWQAERAAKASEVAA